jgi:hypothetical protein
MKECNKCNQSLPDEAFETLKKPNGKQYLRNICRTCRHSKNKTITDHTIMDKDKTITTKSANKDNIIIDNTVYTRLTALEKEVTNIKSQIASDTTRHNTAITDHNYNFDKKNRIKSTYNIEKDIKAMLDKHCKDNLKNNSDIVNIALIEFFDKQ